MRFKPKDNIPLSDILSLIVYYGSVCDVASTFTFATNSGVIFMTKMKTYWPAARSDVISNFISPPYTYFLLEHSGASRGSEIYVPVNWLNFNTLQGIRPPRSRPDYIWCLDRLFNMDYLDGDLLSGRLTPRISFMYL